MAQLRASLATAEQRCADLKLAMGDEAGWLDRYTAERAAHAETRKALEECRAEAKRHHDDSWNQGTRADEAEEKLFDVSAERDGLRAAKDIHVAALGLAIVTEADRKVLEACAAFPIEALTGDLYHSGANRNELSDLSLRWAAAELEARKTRAK